MPLDITQPGVRDPYKHKETYEAWLKKTKKIKGISKQDSDLILTYLSDMAEGNNCSKKNRSTPGMARLNTLRTRIPTINRWIKNKFKKNLTEVTAEQMNKIWNDMHTGKLLQANNQRYTSIYDYQKDFTAFWHWWMKHSKKRLGRVIEDISEDFKVYAKSRSELKFNWVDEEKLKLLMDNANTDYQDLISFLFCAGIRAPTELINVKRKDIFEKNGLVYLHIRAETTKTIPRKIRLLLCGKRISERIKRLQLKQEDFLFDINPKASNDYLNRLGYKLFGFGEEVTRDKWGGTRKKRVYRYIKYGLTMYDFRHSSFCYWVNRYKKEREIMYRFGWKNSKMIEYYTHYLGMKDTISEEDMLVDITKTELEKELAAQKQEKELLKERVGSMEKEIVTIKSNMTEELTTDILKKIKNRLGI